MNQTLLRYALSAALALGAIVASFSHCMAAVTISPDAGVLRQESRWLQALGSGDRGTVASILSENYKHVDSAGKLYDRAQELAGVTKEAVTMKWTQQTVDFAGNVAVVHGLNTMTRAGKTTRERYTDVYVHQNGTWMALSAQETAIAP